MDVFQVQSLAEFTGFPNHPAVLGLMERDASEGAEAFFADLLRKPFSATGPIARTQAQDDVTQLVANILPKRLRAQPFTSLWVADIAAICISVCDMLGLSTVKLSLDSKRGCRRYHVDNISMRTVVAYSGAGTEYLPEIAADRDAYSRRGPNEDIVKDPSAIRYIGHWDVAIIRGGPGGLLHRTPDAALDKPSVFMRVDPVLD